MKNSRDAVQLSSRGRLLQDQQARHAASCKRQEPVRKEAQVQHEHDSAAGLVEQRVRCCHLFVFDINCRDWLSVRTFY